MNGNVQYGVGEFFVVWNGWLNFFCWMSIKFKQRLKLKGQQSFYYEQLSFFELLFFFWGVDSLTWFSKCLTLEVKWDTFEGKMLVSVGCINTER